MASGCGCSFGGCGVIMDVIILMVLAMVKLKITTVGSSAGVVLPKEVLARLKVEKGDVLYLTEAPEGYRITPYDPEFERQMTLARGIMRERRNVLKALAK
jgi:putative addiction module antidote